MRKMSEKELLIEKIEREHTKERVPTRKEMRAIARAKLKASGYIQLNKKRSGKSAFSSIWREWAFKKIKWPQKSAMTDSK